WQRLWRHRRVDVRMLLALGLPALALFSVRSFLEPAMMYQAMEPPPGNLGAYLFEHYNLTAGGITTAVVLGLSCLVQRRNGQAEQSISSALFTVAATAAALPLLSFVAGHLSGGMSAARYVLHTPVGLGLLVGFFTAGLAKSSRLHAAAALGFLT